MTLHSDITNMVSLCEKSTAYFGPNAAIHSTDLGATAFGITRDSPNSELRFWIDSSEVSRAEFKSKWKSLFPHDDRLDNI